MQLSQDLAKFFVLFGYWENELCTGCCLPAHPTLPRSVGMLTPERWAGHLTFANINRGRQLPGWHQIMRNAIKCTCTSTLQISATGTHFSLSKNG